MFTRSGDSVAFMTGSNLTDSNIKSGVILVNDVGTRPTSMAIDHMPTQQSEVLPGCYHQSV